MGVEDGDTLGKALPLTPRSPWPKTALSGESASGRVLSTSSLNAESVKRSSVGSGRSVRQTSPTHPFPQRLSVPPLTESVALVLDCSATKELTSGVEASLPRFRGTAYDDDDGVTLCIECVPWLSNNAFCFWITYLISIIYVPLHKVTELDHNLNWALSFGLWCKMKMHCLALLMLVCSFSTVDASPRSKAVLMGMGSVLAITAAQSFIAALGFTATGIAAGSWAAKLMSIVARLNGGTVPPGSFLTTLQSIGTAGFAFSTNFMIGVMGALAFIIISIKLNIF
uniref:uncharacterized protein n=1 Tax=Pristiophorus japonicus TaxID=55135 RepID=UPI00398EF6BC